MEKDQWKGNRKKAQITEHETVILMWLNISYVIVNKKKVKLTIKTHSNISKHVHTRKNPKQNKVKGKVNNKKIGKGIFSEQILLFIRCEIMNIHWGVITKQNQ